MNLRDTRKPYELSEGELQTLIAKFEKITDTKFDKAFADQVNNFIGIFREKILIESLKTHWKKSPPCKVTK